VNRLVVNYLASQFLLGMGKKKLVELCVKVLSEEFPRIHGYDVYRCAPDVECMVAYGSVLKTVALTEAQNMW